MKMPVMDVASFAMVGTDQDVEIVVVVDEHSSNLLMMDVPDFDRGCQTIGLNLNEKNIRNHNVEKTKLIDLLCGVIGDVVTLDKLAAT